MSLAVQLWVTQERLRSLAGHWNAIATCWPYQAAEAVYIARR